MLRFRPNQMVQKLDKYSAMHQGRASLFLTSISTGVKPPEIRKLLCILFLQFCLTFGFILPQHVSDHQGTCLGTRGAEDYRQHWCQRCKSRPISIHSRERLTTEFQVPFFTPVQDPPAGTAWDPQPDHGLFSPLKIKNLELRNRIIVSPMCQ